MIGTYLETGEFSSPRTMAARLASYISDPSTIRVRVLEYFGTAPSIDTCRKLREQQLEADARAAARTARTRPQAGYKAAFRCGHPRDNLNTGRENYGRAYCRRCRRAKEVARARRRSAAKSE